MNQHTCPPWPARFWEKVNRNGPTPTHRPDLGPCWVWTGARTRQGYGHIQMGRPTPAHTHRVAWALEHGVVPDGMWVLHRCDNPSCVRASHLFLGSAADNMADMIAKGRDRHRSGERHSNAKLTRAAVEEIRRDWRPGGAKGRPGPTRALAAKFGVHPTTVREVVKGRTWT